MAIAPTLTGFEGKTAVITGAGRMKSIGRGIANALASAGVNVAIVGTGRDPETFIQAEKDAGWRDIESVAEELRSHGVKALPIVGDISDEQSVHSIFAQVSNELGDATFLVNNAASSRGDDRKQVIELDTSEWDTVQRVNVRGTFLMSKEFADRAVARGANAAILNISSIGGKLSGPRTAAYSASKAAIQSLTSSMAKELGNNGIRVNAVCPGVIDTSRLSDLTQEQWDAYVQQTIPMNRMGTTQDVANAAMFLLSEQAGWVTGQSWNIDGGQLTIR